MTEGPIFFQGTIGRRIDYQVKGLLIWIVIKTIGLLSYLAGWLVWLVNCCTACSFVDVQLRNGGLQATG